MRTTLILSALAAVVPALGAPTVIPITKRAGPVQPGSYLIKLKDGSSIDVILDTLRTGFTKTGSSITYDYGDLGGFAAMLAPEDLAMVQRQPGVESIEEDSIASISYEEGIDGFSSVSERSESPYNPLPGGYGGKGEGITIFGIDTGIYTEHECFGGRARWGKTFGNYSDADGNGHGTHTAGTAVGYGFGYATGAEIVAVKVLSDQGSGAYSDVIAGVNYAAQECSYGKQCIVTMSLGGSANGFVSKVVENAIKKGLHFTVAAGNSNRDAKYFSPANVPEANTVGAVHADKRKAWFSNWGALLDVWAPGVDIESAWIDGPASVKRLSGTSMATPYVAGILAVALSKYSNYGTISPAELSQMLKDNAQKQAVTFRPKENMARSTSTHSFAQLW